MFLEGLIETLCVDYRECKNFNRLDKYCILLSIIMISVGNVLEYNVTCATTQKEFKIEVHLNKIIPKINNIKLRDMKIPVDKTGEVVVSSPTAIAGDATNIINRITINKKTHDVSGMTNEQLDNIISILPYNVFCEIKKQFDYMFKQCGNIVYYTYKSPYDKDAKPIEYVFNLFDNTFFDFIKLLLKEDLLNYYKIFYSITTKFKFDMQYVQSITPSETKMYMSFIREDIKRRQDQLDQASNKSGTGLSLPLPPDPANND